MSQWGFYFNQDRCVGCKSCTLACKSWNDIRRGDAAVNPISESIVEANPEFYQPNISAIDAKTAPEAVSGYIAASGADNYAEMRKYNMKENWRIVSTHDSGTVSMEITTRMFTTTFERSYLSLGCNHCKQPKCLEACPMGVYYKEQDYGLTLYNNTACISCGRCVDACPWHVPQFYDPNYASFAQGDPKRPKMTKCTGCIDRISQGLKPACVAACWNRALDAGPMEELYEKYSADGYTSSLPQFATSGTGPMIIFRPKKNSISTR